VQGFNAVRLPFLFKDLKAKPQSKGSTCSPVDEAYLKKRTLDPSVQTDKSFPKSFVPLPKRPPGQCNTYLPNTSTLDRYLWTIQWFVANNMVSIREWWTVT